MILFHCACGAEIEVLDAQVGQRVFCLTCRSGLSVPPRSTAIRSRSAPGSGVAEAPVKPYRRPRNTGGRVRGGSIVAERLRGVGKVVVALAGLLAAFSLYRYATRPDPIVIAFSTGRFAVPAGSAPPGNAPARRPASTRSEEAEERARMVAEREERAKEEAGEARELRLREAARLLMADSPDLVIHRSEDVPGRGLVAFLGRRNEGEGPVSSYLVERGVVSPFLGEDRFLWATETPSDLASLWAGRRRGDGPYRTRSVKAAEQPPSLDAVVDHPKTGLRYRLRLLHFNPSGTAEFAMEDLAREP